MRLKQRNNERVAAKVDHMQAIEFEKQQIAEANQRKRLQDQQERQKIMQAIAMSKQEEAH